MADDRISRAAEGFDLVASDYERSRPSYPPGAIGLLTDRLGVGPGVRVADVGAGSGKLTRLLVAEGATVVAVEPSPAMRAVLEATSPTVTVLDATAENMPFDDGDFDVVTVAQAFHWFRPVEALREIRRVLRPGGGLAVLDNDLDDRVEWVKELEKISWPAGTPLPVANSDRMPLLGDAGFVEIEVAQIRWNLPATRESLAERVRSSSSVAAAHESTREAIVEEVLTLVADLGEPFDMPYITDVLWCRRDK